MEALHPELICHKCGGNNPTWSADNDLWNKVTGSPNGILCPTCFFELAEKSGINMLSIKPKNINTMYCSHFPETVVYTSDHEFQDRLRQLLERTAKGMDMHKAPGMDEFIYRICEIAEQSLFATKQQTTD